MVESLRHSVAVRNNVLIVEDHPLYRDALILLLQGAIKNVEAVGVASAEEGLRFIANFSAPHLILLDLNLPGIEGVEAIAAFYRSCPKAMIIVLSSSEDRRDVAAAFRVGARAFISKHVAHSLIKGTIERALSGHLLKPEWIRTSYTRVFTEELSLPLNQRQMEILSLLARGWSNHEIATQVSLAEITVKQNITVIFRALGVENRAKAILAIRRLGLTAGE